MSIPRQIEDGTLTLGTLSKLVTSNEVLSKEWKVKLTWGFKLGKLYGKVVDGPFVQEKFYEGEYTHILLARMHYDFSLALQPLIEAKQRAIRLASLNRKKGGDDDVKTMGERAQEIRDSEVEK